MANPPRHWEDYLQGHRIVRGRGLFRWAVLRIQTSENSRDESVFAIDSAGPTTSQLVPQGLGLSGALKRVALNFLDEPNDSQGSAAVLLDPPC